MERENKGKIYSFLYLVVLLVVAYFPVFKDLSDAPIHIWDEATYANNAIDMAFGNRNILVVQHLEKPDLYNTKPPFTIWMQALCIKAFGINEFAIRLPSAIFGFLTVLLIYFFCVRNLNSKLIGLIASAILVSSRGFISIHVVRTGDLDSTLVFWLVLGILTFIDFVIRKPDKSYIHYSLLSASLIFGFLTKGIAGFFFLPFMFIISLFPSNLSVYKDSNLYYFFIITVLSCTMYYALRESLSPGYLDIVLQSEILRINSVVMSWHVHPFDFYYENMKKNHFDAFFHFLPIALIAPLILKSHKFRISIYLMIVCLGYFIFISYPAVKLAYYAAPLYPLLSILLSMGFIECIFFLRNKFFKALDKTLLEVAILIIAGLYIINPYQAILEGNKYKDNQINSLAFEGIYLKHLKEKEINIQDLIVLKKEKHKEHYDQVMFYIRAYNKENEMGISLKKRIEFQAGDLVMCSQNELKTKLQEKYSVDTVDTWKKGVLYKVKGDRN